MTLLIEQYRELILTAADAAKGDASPFDLFEALCRVYGVQAFSEYLARVSSHMDRAFGEPRDDAMLDTPMGQGSLLLLALIEYRRKSSEMDFETVVMGLSNFTSMLAVDSGLGLLVFLREVDAEAAARAEALLSFGAPEGVSLH